MVCHGLTICIENSLWLRTFSPMKKPKFKENGSLFYSQLASVDA